MHQTQCDMARNIGDQRHIGYHLGKILIQQFDNNTRQKQVHIQFQLKIKQIKSKEMGKHHH